MLGHSDAPLSSAYDLAMLDLDGVVYVGAHAVPGAPRAPGAGAGRGHAVRLHHQQRLAQPRRRWPSTCGSSACRRRSTTWSPRRRRPPGCWRTGCRRRRRVARAGRAGAGRRGARWPGSSRSRWTPRTRQALVSGYGPDVLWRDVMRAAVRVRDGLWWVASNTDGSIPTSYGVAPGHGVLVETVSRFAGVTPVVAGKPERPLLDETVRRVGGDRPLMVGDRLDTDIEGARQRRRRLAAGADRRDRPRRAGRGRGPRSARPTSRADLGGLLTPHGQVDRRRAARPAAAGGRVTTSGGRLEVTGDGSADAWWRVRRGRGLGHLDRTGEVVDTAALTVPRPRRRGGPVTSAA